MTISKETAKTPVQKIPVYLLTGFLGSGKTSHLKKWLLEPQLKNAAVIINEIGEVGLDPSLIGTLTDSASALLGQCVCCSGLQGLEDTLTELWWDRLYKKSRIFDCVVIETTGIADPKAIQALFLVNPLLTERYQLQITITTMSEQSAEQVLKDYPFALAQIKAADLILITHPQTTDSTHLIQTVQSIHPQVPCFVSNHASVTWHELMKVQQAFTPKSSTVEDAVSIAPKLTGGVYAPVLKHQHDIISKFMPTTPFQSEDSLLEFVSSLVHSRLLRLKGFIQLSDQSIWVIQWTLGDDQAAVVRYTGTLNKEIGLTCIERK
jgi:G3E family GTPase